MDDGGALMQAREGAYAGALASRRKPGMGSERLPWPLQALSQTPGLAEVLRSGWCPRR